MPDYRVYYIGRDQHFFSVETIAAKDDDAAIVQAESLCARQPKCVGIEIWDRDRRVHRHDINRGK